MWYYYFFYGAFGWLAALIVLGAVVVMIGCWCCGVSFDFLTMWGEERTTLTCFHCGQDTAANSKMCQNCGSELQ